MTREELQRVLTEFAHIRVLVVGDFCLDRWCTYDPDLACPSRETGIPRTAVVASCVTPGGAGTVTNNLAALGAGRIHIIGVTGDDGDAVELERSLRQRGIQTSHLVRDPARQTFTYTKLLRKSSHVEDLPRVDFVNTAPPGAQAELAMLRALNELVPAADVVLVADQAEVASGAAITERVRGALVEAAARFPEKIFVADSRSQVEKYRGLIVKPNEDEAMEAALRIVPQTSSSDMRAAGFSAEEAGELLRQHLGGKVPLYVTRGAEGVLLFGAANPETPRLILAWRNDNPVDICGAGDAFESGLALALAATKRLYGEPDYAASANVGQLVAAVTITKPGTGTASPAEVLALFDKGKSERARVG